ncbi:restriction endonuclease subunit S [Thermodesulfobacteriota bacterium]
MTERNDAEAAKVLAGILRDTVMGEWRSLRLTECIQRVAIPVKIPRKQFEDSGDFPVVSQEKNLINGYWSDESAVISVESPLVVFGDHTQVLKYIDFDFVVGADGVKLLQPKPFLRAKFFYYFLMANPITALGYARHYRLLKELVIRFPESLPEQERIVAILDEAFKAIAMATASTERNHANAQELFESHLNGISGELVPLGDLVNIRTGKLDANAAVEGGEYPFFTCAREVYSIDNYAFDCEAILLAGNNAVGDFNVKHYKGKFNAYQRTYVVTTNEKNRVLYRYLYFQMLKSLKKFKSQSVGAGTKFLKLGMIKGMKIVLPPRAEQKAIIAKMDSIREETERLESIYDHKANALTELKQSILYKAFTGELTTDAKAVDRTLSEAGL